MIAECQRQTACSLFASAHWEIRTRHETDPFPAILFWIRRAVKNGNETAKSNRDEMEALAHRFCRTCLKPNPQMKCSRCRAVSYCNKTCQTQGWNLGHRTACTNVPVIKIYTKNECAHCGKTKPKFQCKGCKKACYCNKECYKTHWKMEHKEDCKILERAG